jgi:predicted transcriptional regulator
MPTRLNEEVTVRLSPPVRAALAKMARDNDKSMSRVAREYIIDGLRADGARIEED